MFRKVKPVKPIDNKEFYDEKVLLRSKPKFDASESAKDFDVIRIKAETLVSPEQNDPFVSHRMISKIGKGAYGDVALVENKETKQKRALKIINLGSGISKEQEELFFNEIDVLKKLDHPNIIKILSYFRTNNRIYLLTEYCAGGELFDKIIEMKHFSEVEAALIIKQLISAVQFIHEHGIIHRDLKPENILLENSTKGDGLFHIKLIDFGTSAYKTNDEMLKHRYGTPYYVAPEVLSGSYDEKCDVWSCGIILYILLSGRPPFTGKKDSEIYDRIINSKVSFSNSNVWNFVSEDAKDFIRTLLIKDKLKRPSASEVCEHKWLKQFDFSKLYAIQNSANYNYEAFKDSINENKQIVGPKIEMMIGDNQKSLEKAMLNIKAFQAEQKLQQAVVAFIVHNLAYSEELFSLKSIFMQLDKNGDGKLGLEEIKQGLLSVMTLEEAERECSKIFNLLDRDSSGSVEYEEFIRASISIEKIITKENLMFAFNIFDKDKSGEISAQEVKTILGVGLDVPNELWEDLIAPIDINGDGQISYSEFEKMMFELVGKKAKK